MLANKTIFVTGASRGIGKAIALRAARDGANIVIAAKTAEPHPKLPGTIFTAAKEIEEAGGKCLPCIVDVREEASIVSAVEKAVKHFGGIDILVNNASAINLSSTLDIDMKRYDLMHSINTRGTFLTSKICIPHLKMSQNPHILNLSPPLSLNPRWFRDNVAYTMAKYGMSMCVLGMSDEFKGDGIAVNALWPRTAIATAAMEFIAGKEVTNQCRKPEIVADAAYSILTKDSKLLTGKFLVDEDVLKEAGVTDFDQYAANPGHSLMIDFFLDDLSAGSTPLKIKDADANGQASKLFEKMKDLLSDDMVKNIGAIYSFELNGSDSGKWYLDMKSGSGDVGQGDHPSDNADVTLTLDGGDFVKMFAGNLKPTSAFMSGRVKVKGDMGRALKLEKVMSQMRSKL